MPLNDDIGEVFSLFRRWKQEGRHMPGYVWGEGLKYLVYLLDIEGVYTLDSIDEAHPTLVKTILGSHGWTALQVLIARKRKS